MRIACVGGGPAGLYFALLMKLSDPGQDITVFERSAVHSTYGWGVTFEDDLIRKLYNSDSWSAEKIEQAASRWVNQFVGVESKQVIDASGTGYSINRRELLDILASRAQDLGVHIEFDHEVASLAQLPEVDLIVACDGVNSRIRNEAGSFQTEIHLDSHKYIWLGTDKVFESFTYAFVRTGCDLLWAYAYRTDARSSTFIVECSAETWKGLGFDAMPLQDSLSLLEKLFERHLDGHQLIGQARNGTNVRWLNFRTVTNHRWHDGKIVLTGDSAHTTHFSIGSGTKLAIEDAATLAESLQRHGNLELALQSYERQRQAALLQPQSEARCSVRWFDDISRYIDLESHQFATLLFLRRSPLLPHVSPQLYYRLHQATEDVALLRELGKRVAPKAKAISGRLKRNITER